MPPPTRPVVYTSNMGLQQPGVLAGSVEHQHQCQLQVAGQGLEWWSGDVLCTAVMPESQRKGAKDQFQGDSTYNWQFIFCKSAVWLRRFVGY
jgi:hypothetical protein